MGTRLFRALPRGGRSLGLQTIKGVSISMNRHLVFLDKLPQLDALDQRYLRSLWAWCGKQATPAGAGCQSRGPLTPGSAAIALSNHMRKSGTVSSPSAAIAGSADQLFAVRTSPRGPCRSSGVRFSIWNTDSMLV